MMEKKTVAIGTRDDVLRRCAYSMRVAGVSPQDLADYMAANPRQRRSIAPTRWDRVEQDAIDAGVKGISSRDVQVKYGYEASDVGKLFRELEDAGRLFRFKPCKLRIRWYASKEFAARAASVPATVVVERGALLVRGDAVCAADVVITRGPGTLVDMRFAVDDVPSIFRSLPLGATLSGAQA